MLPRANFRDSLRRFLNGGKTHSQAQELHADLYTPHTRQTPTEVSTRRIVMQEENIDTTQYLVTRARGGLEGLEGGKNITYPCGRGNGAVDDA